MTHRKESIKLTLDGVVNAPPASEKSPQTAHLLTAADKSLLDHLHDVVFMLNAVGRFIFVNKASEERTGIPAQALMGLSYLDLVAPEFREAARNSLKRP